MPICVLDEETINKIAAGEVVERPSNVVKELVENSLDAGSSKIEIEIKGAGRQLIRIRDNGSGMTGQEISLAILRHATSKISKFSDLSTIGTLGFRGEALPSIAAVSHLLIQSHQHLQSSGWEVKIAGGKIQSDCAWAGSPGTNIEVSNLFFNTPARAKFLKSDTTERHRIINTLEEISLVYPQTAFQIISEGKTVLNVPKVKNEYERIVDVLGNEFAKTLLPVEVTHPYLKIKAFITRTEHSLSSKNFQFLFVNNRPINMGRSVIHSLYEAYRENLPSGRHPGAIIYLEINPAEIDVNIHPTKREIRFSKENEIHDLLYRSLKGVLSSTPLNSLSDKKGLESAVSYSNQGRSNFNNFYSKEPKPAYNTEQIFKSDILKPVAVPFHQADFIKPIENTQSFNSFGQVFGVYVLAQKNEDFLIIDQHAAAERIRYEKYLKQWKEKHITVQPLLFPAAIELAPSQCGLLRENISLLQDAGWEIEEFGSNTMRLTALPSILGNNVEARHALNEILQALCEESKIVSSEKIEKIIRAACRASIKAGDYLSNEEARKLVSDLFLCESPYTCPHGRPTVFKISYNELEKFFGRKQ